MDNLENYSNYSSINGTMNSSINTNSFTIDKSKDLYCGKCGNKIEISSLYCKYCGINLEKIKDKNINFNNYKQEKISPKDIFSSFSLKRCIMTSLIAVVILFAFSLVFETFIIGPNTQLGKYLNALHLLLLSNFGNIDIYINSFMSRNLASISIGLIVLLILPIIALAISYKLLLKEENISLENHIKNSICVGVVYGLILVIIAKVSNIHLSYNSGFGQYGYSIIYGFSMVDVLFKGFVIGFICMLFLGLKKEYEERNMFVGALRMIPKVIGIGYIVTLILLVAMHFANINIVSDFGVTSYVSKINIWIVLSQLALYIWSFANFIPTIVGNKSISILSLLQSNISFDLLLILCAFVAISLLVFIIVGSKLESKYKNQGIKPVLIFSICYGVAMGTLGLFSLLYVNDSATSIITILDRMEMGFNPIVSMTVSFIYSFIVTLIGFKLNIFNYMEEKNEG